MRLAISTTETLTDLKTDLVVANNNNHFTRQHNELQVDIGLKESVYKLFSFHDIYLKPYFYFFKSIDVSYASFNFFLNK